MSDNDDFSEFMKQLNQKAGGDMGLDDELEQMEKEFGIENKGDDKDDELAKLEQEDDEKLDLDDINGDEDGDGNDDDEKLQKQNKLEQSTKNSKQTEDNKDDIYLEDTEEKYHNPKNIKSVSAIDDEKNICDKIIALKKKLKLDFDYWETKKTLLNQQEEFMTSCIESGTMSVEKYKNLIKKCQDIDKQFLKEIPNDKNLQVKELKELQKRIEKRINITQSELDTEINEEEGEEEEVEKEEPQSQPQQQQQPKQQQQQQKQQQQLKQQQQQPRQIKEETNSYQQNSLVMQSQFKELAQTVQLSAKEFSLIIDIEQRLKEYQSALTYFQENNIETNKKDANTKVKIIKAVLVAIKIGEGQGITMEDMPPKVTPEYICGYSMAERETKFKKVLQYLVTEIKKLKEEKNHINTETNQNKKESNKKLAEIENKIQLKEKEFKELLQFQKDEWIPCPEFGIVEKNIVTEVINEYVKDETMILHISNFTLQIDNFYIEIVLPLETPKKETIFPVKSNTFANDIEWVFTEKEFKTLHKKNIDFKIFKKKVFRSKLYFEFSVKLKPFQNKSIIKEEIKLKNDKKNLSEKISVTAVIRQPLVSPEKTKQVLKEFSIKKKYKKFEITDQNNEFSLSQSNLNIEVNTNHQNNSPPKPSNQPKSSNQAKPSAQPKPPNQTKPSVQPKPPGQTKPSKPSAQPKPPNQTKPSVQPKPPGQTKPSKPSAQPKPPNQTKQQVVPNPKQPIDKSKFSATELKNPESLEFIVSVQVLEYRVTQLQKKMASIEGRIPKELKELFIKTKSKLTQFENALGDQITPIQYKELLTDKINHDQMLCAYFTSIGEQKKADFVQKKVDIMNSEIKELNEMLEQEQ